MSSAKTAERLKEIKQQLDKGVAPPLESVRGFLTWFEVSRRGYRAVTRIRQHLEEAEIETDPDFEFAFIDGQIAFIRAGSKKAPANPQETFRIGRLGSANRKPTTIQPDKPLCEAVTLMLTHDFSQLPVMTTDRDVRGRASAPQATQIIGVRLIGSRVGA